MRLPKVSVREKWGYLYFQGTWQHIPFKEYLKELDTPKNRERRTKEADVMTREMGLGTFEYLRHFPHGSKAHLFAGRPDNRLTVERFVWEVLEPHHF